MFLKLNYVLSMLNFLNYKSIYFCSISILAIIFNNTFERGETDDITESGGFDD
ncbi:hypothetical protein ABH968_004204 [Lysinibacillus sp. RC79]